MGEFFMRTKAMYSPQPVSKYLLFLFVVRTGIVPLALFLNHPDTLTTTTTTTTMK